MGFFNVHPVEGRFSYILPYVNDDDGNYGEGSVECGGTGDVREGSTG